MELPWPDENSPALHGEQWLAPTLEYSPGWQVTLHDDFPLDGSAFPASQRVQEELLDVEENEPGLHCVH